MGDKVTTFVVRQGSPVWVCRGELPYSNKPYKFIRHKMKRDLIFPHPRVPGEAGPGVIALARSLPLVSGSWPFNECFVETNVHPEDPNFVKLRKPIKLSFLDLLEKGMSLFATAIDEYPVIAVFEQYVDEVPGGKWHVEDLGDGLRRHTLNPKIKISKTFHGAGHPAWEEQHR